MIRAIKRFFAPRKNHVCLLTIASKLNHADVEKMVEILWKMGAR